MQETWIWFMDQEDPLEEGKAANSSILAWEIPWTEEPDGLVYAVTQRRAQLSDWVCVHTDTHTVCQPWSSDKHTHIHTHGMSAMTIWRMLSLSLSHTHTMSATKFWWTHACTHTVCQPWWSDGFPLKGISRRSVSHTACSCELCEVTALRQMPCLKASHETSGAGFRTLC